MRSGAKSYMRKGFLIYDKKRKNLPICGEAVSHIWLCNRSLLNFLRYEENLLFFFFSVDWLTFCWLMVWMSFFFLSSFSLSSWRRWSCEVRNLSLYTSRRGAGFDSQILLPNQRTKCITSNKVDFIRRVFVEWSALNLACRAKLCGILGKVVECRGVFVDWRAKCVECRAKLWNAALYICGMPCQTCGKSRRSCGMQRHIFCMPR